MITIDAASLDFQQLNACLRASDEDATVTNCLGHRFLGAGMSRKQLTLVGTPGNSLGAYLNGAQITVRGNAQDAVGDTMNGGKIVVHGSIGDAAGYAMRGGEIYVRDDAGYRAGIHMKQYGTLCPAMVIGGRCGSFLGEYQAGGVILVLGLGIGGKSIVGNFPCTGMHGGRMYLRSDCSSVLLPPNVSASPATAEDMVQIRCYVSEYCRLFGASEAEILCAPFTKIVPDSKNPYKQMYVAN